MQLTAEQQERYSRHLLLDGLSQEKLLVAALHVQGTGPAARWCARYLAASGVGFLRIDEPSWWPELRALGPWLAETAQGVPVQPAASGFPAQDGAQAALDAVRSVAR